MISVITTRCKRQTSHRSAGPDATPHVESRSAPGIPLFLQKSMAVSQPTDAFEQKADGVAGRVMRAPAPAASVSTSAGTASPPIVHEVLRSPGQPLDAATRALMEPRFGHDFGQVRMHSDPKAAESARAVNALAYTVGRHVIFSEGSYGLSSPQGTRLLAHELAHVIQQERGGPSPPPQHGGGTLEKSADAAASALVTGRGPINVGGGSAPGLACQPQSAKERSLAELAAAQHQMEVQAGLWPGQCALAKGTMEWRLGPVEEADASAGSNKRTMQIRFTPKPAFANKTVSFLQTVRGLQSVRGTGMAKIDIGQSPKFRPFYGMNWDPKVKKWVPESIDTPTPAGNKNQPSSTTDPTAYLYDEPWFYSGEGKIFESVAVIPETGETLGALTWGVGDVPDYAETPACSDGTTAYFQLAVEKFYEPKKPESRIGEENYDVILDRFSADDATLTSDQEKRLDPIVARIKTIVAKDNEPAGTTKGRPSFTVVVGGFGDARDKDPMGASEQRAQAVASYLTSQNVPKESLDLRGFGATWARYELGTKEAQGGRNRRAQVRLFD